MPRVLRSSPASEELQAEILGLLAEHDADIPTALTAMTDALVKWGRENLTPKQADLAVEEITDALERMTAK